jgi:hypothetical protein
MWEDMLSNHDVLMGVWEAASKGESKHHDCDAVCLFMPSHMPSHLNIIKESTVRIFLFTYIQKNIHVR